MSIKMIGEQILVAAAPKEQTTAGGIILSADVKTTASEPGVVLAVGPDVKEPIVQGATIYLEWTKSLPVRINGQDAVMISSEYVKAVM
jgi:co-chaperonin GroES (HSP10)